METIANAGILPSPDILEWESVSSKFFANLYADLDGLAYPILAPGVVISVKNQERYVASTTNGGSKNYGTTLTVRMVVTFLTDEEADFDVNYLALRIFDRNENDKMIYFPSYLASLRAISSNFAATRRMELTVKGDAPIDLKSPIPTIPLPPPSNPPTQRATMDPTRSPTSSPTKAPTISPTMAPTKSPTSEPSMAPSTLEPTSFPSASPTKTPVSLPPTKPDETRAPSLVPSAAPSSVPTATKSLSPTAPDETHKPTQSPTTQGPTGPSFQTYFTTNELVLDGVSGGILKGDSQTAFVQITSEYLTNYVDNVLRDSTVKQVGVTVSDQSILDSRRTRRSLQGEVSLSVEFNCILQVASSSSFNAQSLINGAFATTSRRESYRELLTGSGDGVLEGITDVRLPGTKGNNNGTVNAGDDGLGAGVITGIAVGIAFFILAIVVMLFLSSRKKSRGRRAVEETQKNVSTGQLSSQDEVVSTPRGRLNAEIVVDRSADDVSTLGDPFYGTHIDERTCADKTATSASVQQNYDFWKLLGKDPALDAPIEDGEEEETESKVNRNTLYAEDDNSFEEQVFGDMR
eukprot:scaffold26088_cov132-Cylindrotheca_fusiformis.AAC.2